MTTSAPQNSPVQVDLRFGDCLDVLRTLPGESVHVVVTDPPYELAFMGKQWDRTGIAYSVELWAECLRVLKPGGHLAAFGGTRTCHRMTCAIEDAGFEVRDSLMWLYGSGMAKGQDVGKAIDKMRDDKADVLAVGEWLRAAIESSALSTREIGQAFGLNPRGVDLWAPRPTDNSARQRAHVPTWEQWGKLRELLGFGDEMDAEVWRLNGRKGTPGNEREVLGVRTTRTANKLYGAGAGTSTVTYDTAPVLAEAAQWEGWNTSLAPAHEPIVLARKPLAGTVARSVLAYGTGAINAEACKNGAGRWPKNVVIDGHVAADLNGRARYFYCAKAPASERPKLDGEGWPTVKPVALMRWLVRLLTPPAGLVVDPFAGTGPTLQAARDEGFSSIGIERDEFAYRLACARLGLEELAA